MKCQILFPRENKKNIISVSSAEFAHSMVSVKIHVRLGMTRLFVMSISHESLVILKI